MAKDARDPLELCGAGSVAPPVHLLRGSGAEGVEPAAEPRATRVVTFLLDGSRYAVALAAAERVHGMVAVSPVPGAPPVVWGAINLEGRVVPVVDLRRRLRLPPHAYGLSAHLLIVQTPRRKLAVPADEVLGVTGIDPAAITPADAVIPGLGRVAGIAALPEGILFIYDIEAFLTSDEERTLSEALGEERA